MKKEKIFTGKTVEEALNGGLAELGLDIESVTYEVIEKEKKGILGFGFSPAKVKIEYTEKKNLEEVAVDYIKTILKDLDIDAEVSMEKQSGGRYRLAVDGESAGMLIGHHGDTLDALQYLLGLAVNKRERTEDGEKEKGEYMNITLDIENYRAKREEALRTLAKRMSNKVLKYRRSVVLEPMLPYERRIIHSEVQTIEGVSTNSIGSENNRRVVIFLEEVGFEETMANEKNRRASNQRRGDRSERGRDGESRTDRRPRQGQGTRVPSKKKSFTDVIDKIEKNIPHLNDKKTEVDDDNFSDSDYDFSSTAYLREPTKRFSSFAEYESHMASLSANEKEEKKDEE